MSASIFKSPSIKRSRSARKGWKTRGERELFVSRMKSVISVMESKPAVVIERRVLRTTKSWILKYEPDLPVAEEIAFARAVAECFRVCSSARLAEKLDSGEAVETRKAVYTLVSSKIIETTEADAIDRSSREMSETMNLLMRSRR